MGGAPIKQLFCLDSVCLVPICLALSACASCFCLCLSVCLVGLSPNFARYFGTAGLSIHRCFRGKLNSPLMPLWCWLASLLRVIEGGRPLDRGAAGRASSGEESRENG